MRKTIKIILLVLAFVAAVGGVLFFLQYTITPPEASAYKMDYNATLQPKLEAYNPAANRLADGEKQLDVVVDAITLYHEDDLITDEDRDKHLGDANNKFAAEFYAWSISCFQQSVWKPEDHKEMNRLIGKIKKMPEVSEENTNRLGEISSVLSNYQAAWAATKKLDYRNGMTNINTAKSYRSKPYLKNCQALMNAIDAMPAKITQNHYAHAKSCVMQLANPGRFSNYDAFEQANDKANQEINNFANANYGVSKSDKVQELRSLRSRLYDAGSDYNWNRDYYGMAK